MTDYGYMKNKIKQYEKDYENIKNMYDVTGSINRACKNLNVSKIHYYYICDKYNLPRLINKSKLIRKIITFKKEDISVQI